MKKNFALFVCITFSVIGFSESTPRKFAHHSIEVNFSPNFDSYVFTKEGKQQAPPNFPSAFHHTYLPFIGFDLGANYLYQPIRYLGISVGVNSKFNGTYIKYDQLYVDFYGNVTYGNRTKWVGYVAMVTFPIDIHLFLPIKRGGLELASGPEFYLPYAGITNFPENMGGGKDLYSADEIRHLSTLGWDFQLLVKCASKSSFHFLFGPELKLMNLVNLHSSSDILVRNYSVGLRLGFRFGLGKKRKPVTNTTANK